MITKVANQELTFIEQISKKSYNVLAKARAFNKQKCITEVFTDDFFSRTFSIKPLKQNKKSQEVTISSNGNTCTCDAFQIDKKQCSHVLAVLLFIENKSGVNYLE